MQKALRRECSGGLSEALDGFRSASLAQNPVTLVFKDGTTEREFLNGAGRLPVLLGIAVFDLVMLVVRTALAHVAGPSGLGPWASFTVQASQLAALWSLIITVHCLFQRHGAAAQEEILLAAIVTAVLSALVLKTASWVLVSFFLICTSGVLRLRWLLGAGTMAVPVVLVALQNLQLRRIDSSYMLVSVGSVPVEAALHLAIAWAVGALMGFLSDSSRRHAFANHRRALAAATKEVSEVKARAAAENQLAAMQALAGARKRENEAKSEFIGMLCHEIRTPLNGCLASAEMLLQTELNADQRDLAHTVRVSGSILLSTVSNFLDYFKIEANKTLDIVRAPLDLGGMVADVQRIAEAMVASEGEVAMLPPDLCGAPAVIMGDPSRLCGVTLNMMVNAVKFTKRGKVWLRVRVEGADWKGPLPAEAQRFCEQHSVGTSGDGDASGSGIDEGCVEDAGVAAAAAAQPAGTQEAAWAALQAEAAAAAAKPGEQHAGSVHDSVASAPPSQLTPSAAVAASPSGSSALPGPSQPSPGSLQMVVGDEGDGWLSTSSAASLSLAPMQGRTSADAHSPDHHQQQQQWLVFEIMDTGVGVPPRSLRALFHDYVQGDVSDMRKPRLRSGTGLGLAICSKQVAALGGAVGAISKPGCGSVFWFKVPLHLPPGAAAAAAAAAAEGQHGSDAALVGGTGAAGLGTSLENAWHVAPAPVATQVPAPFGGAPHSPAAPAPKPLAGKRILLAEDNLINRKVACRVLGTLGAECATAGNGREAVELVEVALAAGRPFDAVLMDICMPVLSGIEATHEMRAAGFDLPIIAMTANASDRDRDECLAAGMDGFMSKPVLREALAACLTRVMADKAALQEAAAP